MWLPKPKKRQDDRQTDVNIGGDPNDQAASIFGWIKPIAGAEIGTDPMDPRSLYIRLNIPFFSRFVNLFIYLFNETHFINGGTNPHTHNPPPPLPPPKKIFKKNIKQTNKENKTKYNIKTQQKQEANNNSSSVDFWQVSISDRPLITHNESPHSALTLRASDMINSLT